MFNFVLLFFQISLGLFSNAAMANCDENDLSSITTKISAETLSNFRDQLDSFTFSWDSKTVQYDETLFGYVDGFKRKIINTSCSFRGSLIFSINKRSYHFTDCKVEEKYHFIPKFNHWSHEIVINNCGRDLNHRTDIEDLLKNRYTDIFVQGLSSVGSLTKN